MGWKENAIVYSSIDNGTSYQKWSDHNRAPLDITLERIERVNRMADGTMRRYSVAKKRTFTLSWEMFPSVITPTYLGRVGLGTVDAGYAGEDIQNLYNTVDGAFKIKLRKGTDEAKTSTDATLEVVNVMFTDFNKSIVKRGVVDFWSLNVTLEEI